MLQIPNGRIVVRALLLLLGTGIGIALLALLLRSINPRQLGNDFANADYRYLLLAIIPWLAALMLKVPRWRLLYGADAPRWSTLFAAMNVGYAINTLLPARLGEVVRAYWVRDRTGVSMVRSLSTIAVERVTDGVAVVIMLVATVPTVAFPRALLGPALTLGAIFFAVLIGMGVLAFSSGQTEGRLARFLRTLEQGRFAVAVRMMTQVFAGLHALRSRRSIALLALYTVLIWTSNVLLSWVALRAFHLAVPFPAAILLTSVLNLGMAVPSSPGYVGVYEYLMVLTLSLYGIAHTPALATAFAYHVISFVPIAIIGLMYIARSGVESTVQMVRVGASEAEV
jgi:uncharacterized protein (TIRG00374 family)